MAETKAKSSTAAADAKDKGSNAARAAAIAAKVPNRPFDPKDPNIAQRVKIRVPVDRVNAGNTTMVVGLNGVFYTIQRGKDVEVPKAVADIVRHSLEQDDKAVQYMESLPTEGAPLN